VQENILEQHPEISVELLILKTTGDRIQDRPLSEVGGKGLFIKELETALLDGRADMAVHSMKDVTGFSQKVWKYQLLLNVKIQVTRGSVRNMEELTIFRRVELSGQVHYAALHS